MDFRGLIVEAGRQGRIQVRESKLFFLWAHATFCKYSVLNGTRTLKTDVCFFLFYLDNKILESRDEPSLHKNNKLKDKLMKQGP